MQIICSYNHFLSLLLIVCNVYLFFYVAAEVMFRNTDYTVFESDFPVQFELLLQPDPMPDGDITVQIVTVDNTATGMYILKLSSIVTFHMIYHCFRWF